MLIWMGEQQHYAYSYVALYGKAYVASAKETWNMMKDRGLDALVQDCLVSFPHN